MCVCETIAPSGTFGASDVLQMDLETLQVRH